MTNEKKRMTNCHWLTYLILSVTRHSSFVIQRCLMKSLLLTWMALSLAVRLGASGLDVEEKETIQKTFNLAATVGEIRIDNIDGSIHVAGQAGSDIQFIIEKTLRGESKEKIDLARQEVKLDDELNIGTG